MSHPAYDSLATTWRRLHHFSHLQSLAGWDRAALMPAGGNAARADAMAEMDGLLHGIRTDPAIAAHLDQCKVEVLDEVQQANLREMHRDWRNANALPVALVQAQSLANARCEHAWQTQRPANDWRGFLDNFREVLTLEREKAKHLADQSGLGMHDALMDVYEPGMTGAKVDKLFGDLQTWLPALVRKVREKQSRENVVTPVGPFAKSAQYAMGLDAMKLLGFDFNSGRLDESAHPFCGGSPEDTRLTTRYREDSFVGSLWGTMHETGHALYEQGVGHIWARTPLASGASSAVHESNKSVFGRLRRFLQPFCIQPLSAFRVFVRDVRQRLRRILSCRPFLLICLL